jgi:hypothetical protein
MQEPLRQERPIEKSTTAPRQGVTGHNVRYVLAVSLGVANHRPSGVVDLLRISVTSQRLLSCHPLGNSHVNGINAFEICKRLSL